MNITQLLDILVHVCFEMNAFLSIQGNILNVNRAHIHH